MGLHRSMTEHCKVNVEPSYGLESVEAPNFFSGLICNTLNCNANEAVIFSFQDVNTSELAFSSLLLTYECDLR